MSIRIKFVAILALFSILPSVITGLLALTVIREAMLEKTVSHAAEHIYMVGERINLELFHKYEKVLGWSEEDSLADALKNTDLKKAAKALESIESHDESLSYLALLAVDGELLGVSDGELVKYKKNFSGHQGFQKALSGCSLMEDVEFDEIGRELTLLLFSPVRDSSDYKKVRGVLLAAFRWEHFSGIIKSLYVRAREHDRMGHIMLARKNGMVISGSGRYFEYGADLIGKGLKSAQLASLGKKGFVVEKSEHNELSLTSYTPLSDYQKMPNPGWLIILRQDYNDLMVASRKIQKIIVTATLTLSLLLFYVSLKSGKIAASPILRIAAAANRVGSGDLTEIIDIPPYGEIKTLAVSFNSMIAELRKSREQLIQSHDYLSGVLSSMSDSLIVVCDGKIKEVNWAALTSLGYASEELIGMDMGVLFSEVDNPLKNLDVSSGDIQFVDRETSLKTRSGETFPVLLNCSRLSLAVADPFAELEAESGGAVDVVNDLILIAKDITERKKMEEELIVSQKSAIEANRAKGVFLSNMSHEIRTPMNAIIGMTTLVLDIEKDPEKVEYLNVVKMSAEALLTLLNDLLDISKIEAGKLQLQKVDFDLRRVVHDSIKSIAFNAHSKNVEMILNISPSIHSVVNGDPLRLRQVIINLAGNAIKFTDSGEVELKVSPVPHTGKKEVEKEVEKEGIANYLFSVRDTGKGIPDEKLEKIFDSFYQVDDSDSRRHDGTGLGLSISREIIELMDGRIWGESEPGEGTTFFFNVRLVNRSNSLDQMEGRARDILKGKKILIVDDNKTNRLLLRHTVELSGCEAVEAVDGSDAMDKFAETGEAMTPIDLVLMDYCMPGVNGVEAVSMIRKKFDAENTRFLILSSAERPFEISGDKNNVFLETVLKPVNQTELLYKMSSAIREISEEGKVSVKMPGYDLLEARKNRKILLAEDKKVNQMLAVKLLEKQGYSVRVVKNGREAIRALKKERFDLVLMDVRMPEMDGLEATREIRASDPEALPVDIPIVAMSAFAMEEDKKICLDAGMDDHVAKPVDRDKLFSVLDKWLASEPEK